MDQSVSNYLDEQGSIGFPAVPMPAGLYFTGGLWAGAAILMLACFLTSEPVLLALSLAVLVLLPNLLWRRGEPPVLMICCAVQWLQVSAALFYAVTTGEWPEGQAGVDEVREATFLGLVGLAVLAVGMRTALLFARGGRRSVAAEHFASLSPKACFTFYLLAFGGTTAISVIRFAVPQLTQLFGGVIDIKWVAFFLLGMAVASHRGNYGFLAVATLIEFSIGWLGYFSSFKQVVFPLMLIVLTVRDRLHPRRLIAPAILVGSFLPFLVFWSAVKVDYRGVLNEESGEQKTALSVQERVENLLELGGSMDQGKWDAGWEHLISRIAYVDMLGKTLENIPGNMEHSNGLLLMRSLRHVFQPRILFPNKEAVDDSEVTRFCTGMYVAGAEQGTSISAGYMAESYADFGAPAMFVPVFLMGGLLGMVFGYFAYHTSSPAIGAAAGSVLLVFRVQLFESSNIKILGSVVSTFVVMAILERFFGASLARYLHLPPETDPDLPQQRMGAQ